MKEIIAKFSQDRNGEVIDRYVLKKVIDIFVDMGQKLTKPTRSPSSYFWAGERCLTIYKEHFEATLLQRCTEEYSVKA
jgi:hypothetical protein